MPTIYVATPSRYNAFDQVTKQIQLFKVIKVGLPCMVIFSVLAFSLKNLMSMRLPCRKLLSQFFFKIGDLTLLSSDAAIYDAENEEMIIVGFV